MIRRALRMAFWVYYDHLGKFLLLNLLCSLVLLAPLWIGGVALLAADPALAMLVGLPAYFLLAGVLLPLMLTGMLALARQIIDERTGELRDFVRGIRQGAGRAIAMGMGYALVSVCLLTSVWFYAGKVGAVVPWAGYGLSAAAGWALLLTVPTAPWAFTALVFRRCGVRGALRLAAGLALGQPGLSLAVCGATLALTALALAPPVFLLFSVAPAAILWASAYEMLARHYAVAGGQPIEWNDANDDLLNRGWRDLLFPWKV